MRLKLLVVLGILLALATPVGGSVFRTIKPEKAVMAAAKAQPDGVAGVFEITVRAFGYQGGQLFINSESDYRDPRNLTIAMSRATGAALQRKTGLPIAGLLGRKIFVRGVAHTVRIDFTTDGQPSGKYYYQTHVLVSDPVQIAVKDKL